jgi:hypothetical protein
MQVEHRERAGNGALSEDALRRKLAARGCHVTGYTCTPGTYFPQGSHAVDTIDALLSGRP